MPENLAVIAAATAGMGLRGLTRLGGKERRQLDELGRADLLPWLAGASIDTLGLEGCPDQVQLGQQRVLFLLGRHVVYLKN